ncbi:hypothetical protein K438DRAFT_1815019 [Mycena galopus ATCC 62051]|nr:hypothetical protein K438DRAFT_1815019 [Mycena galopus ATCC 62051]
MPQADTTEKKRRRKERKLKEEEDIRRCEAMPSGRIATPTLFNVSTIIFEDDGGVVYPPTRVHTVATTPRDFSSLRSDSSHPWRTIRRRNQRLLPQRPIRRPFPQSLPKKPVVPPQPTLQPAAAIHLVSENPNDHIPVLLMPRPLPLPSLPYDPLPLQNLVSVRSLPAETAYGPVQSGLALVCAREHPWAQLACGEISVIAWGSYSTAGSEFLLDLPPDQLVFLAVLARIVELEPVFEGFLYPAIANFADTWAAHCSGLLG